MNNTVYKHLKNIFPCLVFSALTGIIAAIVVTAFKIAAEFVVHLSSSIYGGIRANPIWLPILVISAAMIGFLASLIWSVSSSCRGGGIPTSVAAIRGIVSFNWLRCLIVLPISSLLTFLCGLPLGTEGPCVQMGTAVGDGVVQCLGNKKHAGWRRYIMTGGASAGFSIATSSPVAAIMFSMEELHKHFSPLLLTVASISITSAQITMYALSACGIGTIGLFQLPTIPPMPPRLLFVPLFIGILSGIGAILLTHLYHIIDKFIHSILKRVSCKILLPVLFVCVSTVGFFLADTLYSGHALVISIFQTETVWYMLILILLIRAICMTVSNTAGATGGVFLPTLAFGAIIGALCAKALIALGWIEPQHYILMVILGIASFLGATSRIPLTACVFAIESMNGIRNVLPIIIATTVAFITAEISGLEDFTDTVINARIHKIANGKIPLVVETPLTVKAHSFAIGKEIRDVLWPNSCVVISFEHSKNNNGISCIGEGDIITVRYSTYNPTATIKELEDLVGAQSDEIRDLAKSG